MLAKPDPSTFQVLPWRGEAPGDRPDVLRHPDARRLPVVRRPALRAQAHPGQGRRPGLHLLHPPRDRVLPASRTSPRRARRRCPVDDGGYFDHTPHDVGHDFRRQAITMLESMGISVEFSHHEGAPGPAGDRPALRRRADHRRQHHDVPPGHEGGRARAGRLRHLHAEAVHRAPRAPACTRTCPCSRATATRSTRPAREYQLSKVGRSFIAGLLSTPPRSPPSPTSGSTPTSGSSGGGEAPAYVCWGHNNRSRAGPRPDVQAAARASRPASRSARLDSACNPYLAFAVLLAAGLKGIEEGYELPAGRRGRRLGADRRRAPRDGHRRRCRRTSPRRSR